MRRAQQAVAVRRRRTRIIVVSWRGLWYAIARFLGLDFRSSCVRLADTGESGLVQSKGRAVLNARSRRRRRAKHGILRKVWGNPE